MAHIVATARPSPVANPSKTLVNKYVVLQIDTDPSGVGTLVSFRAKLTNYDPKEPEFLERDAFNTITKLMEPDVSIATKVGSTEIELELDEPRSTDQLALINAKVLYVQACIWLGDPRDAASKCAMSSNAFGATMFVGFKPSDDEFAKIPVKLKVTSPGITWSSDVTLT